MTDFSTMGLPTSLEQALQKLQFLKPTPIQAQAVPVALTGRDLIGCAQTGTGKTAAFCIPLLARLQNMPGKGALILAPTRELAFQIANVLRQLTDGQPEMRPSLVIGGANMHGQKKSLARQPRLIVATPGRLMDHMGSKTVNLSNIGILVLDEADQMLDMGFAPQLERIARVLPTERQTLLFSATLPDKILALASKYLRDPARVTVGAASRPVERITQSVVHTTVKEKNDVLLDELNARKGSILIFVRTKSRTERLARYLDEYGYEVGRIHGGRTQAQRTSALLGFREGTIRILVATDIAARGLDVPQIAHVINYDLPQAPEDYVHRVGRTARAGAAGEALCLLVPEDKNQWRLISKFCQIENGGSGFSTSASSGVKGSGPRPARAERRAEHGSGRTERPTRPSSPQFASRSERPQQAERAERPHRRAERPERSDRPFRAQRSEYPQRAEGRGDRYPRKERGERPERSEGKARPSRFGEQRPERSEQRNFVRPAPQRPTTPLRRVFKAEPAVPAAPVARRWLNGAEVAKPVHRAFEGRKSEGRAFENRRGPESGRRNASAKFAPTKSFKRQGTAHQRPEQGSVRGRRP